MTTSNKPKLHDFPSAKSPRVVFGYEIPDQYVEKGGPFLMGMLTTYVLQVSAPIVLYYVSVVFQFLRVAFVWIAIPGVICWYTGIIDLQAPELQQAMNRVLDRLGQKPVKPQSPIEAHKIRKAEITKNFPKVSAPESIVEKVVEMQPESRSPRSRSPVRHLNVSERPPVSPMHAKPDLHPTLSPERRQSNLSPTINVRPFVAPIRDETQKFHTQPRIPQVKIPIPQRSDQSMLTSNRRFATPRGPKRYSTAKSAKPVEKPVNSRRDSAESSSSVKSTLQEKPLPPLTKDSLPQNSAEIKLRDMTEKERSAQLARKNSITSEASVLGTRANYSKFVANVDK